MFRKRAKTEPGDPHSAIRMVNHRGVLRVEIGSGAHALRVIHPDGERCVEIGWDGQVKARRIP